MQFKEVKLSNGAGEIIDVSATPKLIRRGVLSVKSNESGEEVSKPIYVVELAEEATGSDIASVYRVKPGSNPPIKDFDREEKELKYRESTYLGKLANASLKKAGKKQRKVEVVEKPPLFLAPVTTAINTFTGELERGFFEREKDQLTIDSGKVKMVYGQETGVFIGLKLIMWEKAFVNTGDLVSQYIQDKAIWFDLTTDDPSNIGGMMLGG